MAATRRQAKIDTTAIVRAARRGHGPLLHEPCDSQKNEGRLAAPFGYSTKASAARAAIAYNSGISINATMLMILISGFTAGPAVSLYGSPTVSPVTAALCASEPLPP